MRLESPAFPDGGPIPRSHSCDGEGRSPALAWSDVPAGATSLALVVHDPDAPVPGGFTHWVLYDIPITARGIAEGGTAGRTGTPPWVPPCPPSGRHHYEFTLFAFAERPDLGPAPDRAAVLAAAEQALATATLTGTYAR